MSETLSQRLLRLSASAARPVLSGSEATRFDGRELDRLIRRRVLVERAPATEWSACETCECDLDSRPIQRDGDRILAACPLSAGNDTVLTDADLRSFDIDVEAMLRSIVEDSGVTGGVNLIGPDLWSLTPVVTTPLGLRAVYFARGISIDVADSVIALIHATAGKTPATLLVPEMPPTVLRLRFEYAGVGVVAAAGTLTNASPLKPFQIATSALAPTLARPSITEPQTLADALVSWGDTAAVAEMNHLAEEGYDGPMIAILGGQETEYERNVIRYRGGRAQLEQAVIEKLKNGSLVATGYDSHAPIDASPITIPDDRWRVLTPNFEDSSATGAGMTITGILVREDGPATALPARAAPPRLQIGRTTRRVRLDDTALRLSPRSFNLLLVLAEAVVAGGAPVPRRDIETRLWSGHVSKKAVADAVHKLKGELVNQGVVEAAACLLIENRRAIGYRLTVTPPEIRIAD